MQYTLTMVYSGKDMEFEQSTLLFYDFMGEAGRVNPIFRDMSFGSGPDSASRPVPLELGEFVDAVRDNAFTMSLEDGRSMQSFEMNCPSSNIGEYSQILGMHNRQGPSSLGLTVVNVTREGIRFARRTLDGIIGAMLRTYPVMYVKENVVSDPMAWAGLDSKVGWAVYAPTMSMSHVKGFPAEEFYPGFLRIRSVEEVFDINDPEHAQKALELSDQIMGNKTFVALTGFW